MDELWDAYDCNGNKIPGITLIRNKSIIQDDQYHLISGVIIKHIDGTYLLMKRDPQKTCGGKWDFTAIGAVKQGESALEGAVRELKEETGITCHNLELVSQIAKKDFHSIFTHYIGIVDCPKDSVVLQESETVAYRWVDRQTLLQMDDDDFASPNERNLILKWEKKVEK